MKAESIKERGQSILEVLIALGVLAMSLSAAVYLFFSGQSMLVDSRLNQKALYLARQNMEEARLSAISNFGNLQSSSSADNGFLKELVVEQTAEDTKKIISRVSWNPAPLRTSKKELITYLTDWRSVSLVGPGAGGAGGGGGGGLFGDWLNPQTLSSFDLGPGNEGMDVEVKNNTVFMVAKASDENKKDFYVVDVTNPASPTLKKDINTGEGLVALSIRGNYAYAAHNNDDNQIQIINISDEFNPVLTKSFDFQSNNEEGKSIYSLGGFVYVGSEKSSGKEFQIFDISDPLNPIFKSSVEINANVNDIYVLNDRAYLATARDDAEILIFNVSDSASPSQIGSFNNSGSADGLSVFASSDSLVFAGIGNNFVILNAQNLDNITIRSFYAAGGNVNDLYARESLAFLGTSDSNKEFQIVNISDLDNAVFYSSYNFPQVATGVDYRDNTIYVSVRSNDALRIITSQ